MKAFTCTLLLVGLAFAQQTPPLLPNDANVTASNMTSASNVTSALNATSAGNASSSSSACALARQLVESINSLNATKTISLFDPNATVAADDGEALMVRIRGITAMETALRMQFSMSKSLGNFSIELVDPPVAESTTKCVIPFKGKADFLKDCTTLAQKGSVRGMIDIDTLQNRIVKLNRTVNWEDANAAHKCLNVKLSALDAESNATMPNATMSNATMSNATTPNATTVQ